MVGCWLVGMVREFSLFKFHRIVLCKLFFLISLYCLINLYSFHFDFQYVTLTDRYIYIYNVFLRVTTTMNLY